MTNEELDEHLMRSGGFSEEALEAMTKSPDYFVWWYTVKSVALCGAVAALAFFVGRESGRKR